jgi:hypothetical protein
LPYCWFCRFVNLLLFGVGMPPLKHCDRGGWVRHPTRARGGWVRHPTRARGGWVRHPTRARPPEAPSLTSLATHGGTPANTAGGVRVVCGWRAGGVRVVCGWCAGGVHFPSNGAELACRVWILLVFCD